MENQRTERRTPRRSFLRPIGILVAGQYFVVEGLEVSEAGVRLHAPLPLPVGQKVVVSLTLLNGKIIVVPAESRERKSDSNDGSFVSFVGISIADRRLIRSYVSSRDEV